jgi:3',5'-cyclic-AMP phosphodiesterase
MYSFILKKRVLLFSAGLILTLLFSACDELFDYSVYDNDVNYSGVNNSNLEMVTNLSSGDTITFAFFSDTHSYYDEFASAVKSINKNDSIQFAICGGDITEAGLSKEFNYYYDIADDLNVPVITAIGNHDYLSNGASIYTAMFGDSNFSFYMGNFHFVFFNDVIWENNNQSPDFDWLNNTLQSDTVSKAIIVSHIPPWDEQFNESYSAEYSDIVSKSSAMLALHGHFHSYQITQYAGIPALVATTIYNRHYYVIRVWGKNYSITDVSF